VTESYNQALMDVQIITRERIDLAHSEARKADTRGNMIASNQNRAVATAMTGTFDLISRMRRK
jgi:hypothetical protein